MHTKDIQNMNNQNGSVLVMVLVVLLALTALGIMAMRTGNTELDVAANDKFHKMVFFAADGVNEMTTELIEQNIEERGFSTSTWGGTGEVSIANGDFYANAEDSMVPDNNIPSPTNRDIEVPNMGENSVYLRVYGNSTLSTGSALQIAAGYEGIGKSVAGGGAQIVYEVRSLGTGPAGSRARIWLRWRHLI
jgi:hypothetical protein